MLPNLEFESYKRLNKVTKDIKVDKRLTELTAWLTNTCQKTVQDITQIAGDASFRRYFRVTLPDMSLIAMDAPTEKENSHPFVAIAEAFANQGVIVPTILQQDLTNGFLLLTDFGDDLLLSALNDESVDGYYQQAIDELLLIQQCQHFPGYSLPIFDEHLIAQELALFPDWFLRKQLKLSLSPALRDGLASAFAIICAGFLAQPRLCVHRDYHSRNLMVLADGRLGVLDFQDAVIGPVSYDLVSLLKDCYIAWPRTKVEAWVKVYYDKALNAGILTGVDFDEFLRWFDWVGIQRHIKVLGIFSRLHLRDGKPGYLEDIPLVMNYLLDGLQRFPELAPFYQLLQQEVLPAYQQEF
ncbi:MAG: aminoglycoside phosphotransferase [Legionellales bacterium]|nr:aminoglycoside phosphotransferase [Legionellales bacterium]|tara:strand:- start:3642 stop:4703 length:1062 start_codon:yes stop_codon:yes gene_type:complete